MVSDERWDWRHGEASGEQAFAATRPMFGTVDSHNNYQACCSAHVSLQDHAKLPSLHITTVSEDEEARSQSQVKEAGVEEEETAVGWQS